MGNRSPCSLAPQLAPAPVCSSSPISATNVDILNGDVVFIIGQKSAIAKYTPTSLKINDYTISNSSVPFQFNFVIGKGTDEQGKSLYHAGIYFQGGFKVKKR